MTKIVNLRDALYKTNFLGITPPLKQMLVTKENVLSLFERINQYEKLLADTKQPPAAFDDSLWNIFMGTTVTCTTAMCSSAYEYFIEKTWEEKQNRRGYFPFSVQELLRNNTEWHSPLLFSGFLEAIEIMTRSVLQGSLNRGYRSLSVLFKEPTYNNSTIFRLLGRHSVPQLGYLPRSFSLQKLSLQDEFKTPEVYNTLFQKNEHRDFVIYEEDLVRGVKQ